MKRFLVGLVLIGLAATPWYLLSHVFGQLEGRLP